MEHYETTQCLSLPSSVLAQNYYCQIVPMIQSCTSNHHWLIIELKQKVYNLHYFGETMIPVFWTAKLYYNIQTTTKTEK